MERRFVQTLIDERARLKNRLDGLEVEHQALLGNVRMLHSSLERAQEDATKQLRAKAASAAKWHDEARILFSECGNLREERNALLATTEEQRGQLGRLDAAAKDLRAKVADGELALEAAEQKHAAAEEVGGERRAMAEELRAQLDAAREEAAVNGASFNEARTALNAARVALRDTSQRLEEHHSDAARRSEAHAAQVLNLKECLEGTVEERDQLRLRHRAAVNDLSETKDALAALRLELDSASGGRDENAKLLGEVRWELTGLKEDHRLKSAKLVEETDGRAAAEAEGERLRAALARWGGCLICYAAEL